MNGALLVCGTSSDAGKSLVVTGLCRALVRRGVGVAPFKAQNMSLNSAVTPEGAEIGRAQIAQAAACRIEPEAAMNPILLKPTGERTSQVVVMGRATTDADAVAYHAMKPELLGVVLDALTDLRSRFDVVVCEGAGSPAEINLRDNDLVNMGLARAAKLPVVVVGEIDRGGVFASLFGSVALLDDDDQALVAGFVVNKFRGDQSILDPGLRRLESLTGRPVLGVLPWLDEALLDAEDSLALSAPRTERGDEAIVVAVPRLRRMSNFTDIDALAAEPGVAVRFTLSPREIFDADLVVVPGTKTTVDDLRMLRERGIDRALAKRAERGLPVLGVCGGYQMLGTRITDDVESGAGSVDGLGLLPVSTTFAPDKILGRTRGTSPAFDGAWAEGYEIHHGRTTREGDDPLFVTEDGNEGCRAGSVLGTSWHGVLESDDFRRALLRWVASVRGAGWEPGVTSFADIRDARFERIADLLETHLDMGAIEKIISDGPPSGLPTVRSTLS